MSKASELLTKIALNDANLIEADLSNGWINNDNIGELAKALENNTHLKMLNIAKNELTDQNTKQLVPSIARSALESVDMSGNLLSTFSGIYAMKGLGIPKFKMIDLGLLEISSITQNAKVRLLLQHNIPFERTEELLAQDPYQKGLYFITQELKNRADEFGMVLFAKHEEFVGRVIRRVLFLDFVEKHPDVHDNHIGEGSEPLLVILGLNRTGTTLLYNLMSQNEGVRAPKTWEIYYPTPPPRKETYETDERIEATRKLLSVFEKTGYSFGNMHKLDANWPEECLFAMREINYYTEYHFTQTFSKHGYLDWFYKQDVKDIYRECKLFLQVISYYYKPTSHWLLKAPYHLNEIDTLLETYSKNTRLILCHRDPIISMGSTFSLFCGVSSMEWPNYNPKPAARFMLTLFAQAWDHMIDILDQMEKEGRSHLICHVYYSEFVKNPLGTVGKIHNHFGLAPPSDSKMQSWLNDNPPGKHGSHSYSLAEFGISDHEVYTSFRKYYLRFFPALLPSVYRSRL